MTHINAISCGQGAPSLFLIVMAGEGLFPCDHVVVADTGWERDMLWNTGRRSDAKTFFEEVTKPLAESYGMTAAFSRAMDGKGNLLPDLDVAQWRSPSNKGKHEHIIDIPLWTKDGKGRSLQSCTGQWKIRAVRQELRRNNAKTATVYLGLYSSESYRCKPSDVEWVKNAWPLVDFMEQTEGVSSMNIGKTWDRQDVYNELVSRDIPYIISSECDGCPHKNLERWRRTHPDTIERLADFEKQFNGEWFLTKKAIPLKDALLEMEKESTLPMLEMIDSCDSGYCFV